MKVKKPHPCAFLSKWFSPEERYYDVGNREFLAGKWALEGWRLTNRLYIPRSAQSQILK
jgi:hypothetical protein